MNKHRNIDFFLVGAPKCGTTSMNYYLDQHPHLFLNPYKDLCYYTPELIEQDDSRHDQMANFLPAFTPAADSQLLGYSSSMLLFSEYGAERIKAHNPQAKILVMLRNPVDMLYSYYEYIKLNGMETAPTFEEALKWELERKAGKRLPPGRVPLVRLFYSEWADYAKQLNRYFDLFLRENIHITFFDYLKKDAKTATQQIFKFLGVRPDVPIDYAVQNEGKASKNLKLIQWWKNRPHALNKIGQALLPAPVRTRIAGKIYAANVSNRKNMLDPEMRMEVMRQLQPKVEALEQLLDTPLPHWKPSSGQ